MRLSSAPLAWWINRVFIQRWVGRERCSHAGRHRRRSANQIRQAKLVGGGADWRRAIRRPSLARVGLRRWLISLAYVIGSRRAFASLALVIGSRRWLTSLARVFGAFSWLKPLARIFGSIRWLKSSARRDEVVVQRAQLSERFGVDAGASAMEVSMVTDETQVNTDARQVMHG